MTLACSSVGRAAQADVEQPRPALHPEAHPASHRPAERLAQASSVHVADRTAIDGHDAVPGAQPAAGRRAVRRDLDDPQPVLLAVGEAGVHAADGHHAAGAAGAQGEGADHHEEPSDGGVAGSPRLDNEVRTDH